jgi:hypothetical protein
MMLPTGIIVFLPFALLNLAARYKDQYAISGYLNTISD